LRPNWTLRALAAFLPSCARFTIRLRSSQDALRHGAGQIQVGLLVENLHQCFEGRHTLNDLDTVEHRSGRPVPSAAIALPSWRRPIVLLPGAFPGRCARNFGNERAELPIQVFMLRADARMTDFSHRTPAPFKTDFLTMVGFLAAFQVVTQS